MSHKVEGEAPPEAVTRAKDKFEEEMVKRINEELVWEVIPEKKTK